MRIFYLVLNSMILAACGCAAGAGMLLGSPTLATAALPYIFIHLLPSPANSRIRPLRLRMCAQGSDLLKIFLIAMCLEITAHAVAAFFLIPSRTGVFLISCSAAFLSLSLVFWNGIFRVYATSVQLGIKRRVVGALCGWVPVLNLFVLCSIIRVTRKEADFEYEKIRLNERRAAAEVCKTRYPLLLVHGVFFRDFRYLNYWGRVPKELEKNGAVIYYGNHQSALSVAESGAELAERIRQITEETGCQKVNIIAHSKGGMDCRYAISLCGAADRVASLTTINTPHRGCLFADYLLQKTSRTLQQGLAAAYNKALRKLGDASPDFLSAVRDLTEKNCRILNEQIRDQEQVYYQSVGSRLNRAANGKFPLNFSYHIARHFSGENDGLVAKSSFSWGSHFTYLTAEGKRGISHGDMIDLNRENIDGFDVREFYVQLVSKLKEGGF